MCTSARGLLSAIPLLVISACASTSDQSQDFIVMAPETVAEVERLGARPWTDRQVGEAQEDFEFAIVGDLTGGYREGVFDVAVAALNRFHPSFVMSVGDLIEGYSDAEAENRAEWDRFDDLVEELDVRFFYASGNHDIGNSLGKRVWEERYGPTYYSFVYGNCLFLVLNTEDFSEAGFENTNRHRDDRLRDAEAFWRSAEAARQADPQRYQSYVRAEEADPFQGAAEFSAAQMDFIEAEISRSSDVRWTFVFLHKPIWVGDGAEDFHELTRLLNGRPYTVFAGHAHTYSHSEINGASHIVLGTTGGVNFRDETGTLRPGSFDHIALVKMSEEGPIITNLMLNGILDENAELLAGGEALSLAGRE